MRSRKGNVLVLILIITVAAGIGGAGLFWWQQSQRSGKVPVECEGCGGGVPTKVPEVVSGEMANWKTFALGEISFKYPPEWKDPNITNTKFGQSVLIINRDMNTQVLIILTGINSTHTETELSKFLDSLVKNGWQKTTLDGNEAAVGQITPYTPLYTEIKAKSVAVYVTAKDKKSQYNISLLSNASFSDREINALFAHILSTFKFLDQKKSVGTNMPCSSDKDCLDGYRCQFPKCDPANKQPGNAGCYITAPSCVKSL